MYRPSFHRLMAVFPAFVFFAFSISAQGASALWIAESKGAIKVAGDSGEILFEIPQAGGVDGIAVDSDGGRVWVVGGDRHGRRLKAYDTDGAVDVDVAVPPIHKHAESIDMLVDAGGVWLAARHELFRFDTQGQLQNRISFRLPVNSMALDTERGYLWVAVPGHVFIVDQEGNDVDRFRTHFPLITQLDYDAGLDSVWLVAGPYLLRLNAADRELAFVSRFGVGFKLWRHLSADGHGGVWGADPVRLSHVNAAGEIEFTFKPFKDYRGQKTLQDLVADREDGSVWLANRTTLKQYSVVGAQHKELTPDLGDGVIRSINRLAFSAQTRPPELTITFPTPNSYLNTGTPTIELHYSSEGTLDTGSIAIKHNDTVLTADCTANQTEATCTLSNALPEGEVTLTATIADTDGNASEPAQVTFTVDTLAPVVDIDNPVDGLITNNNQLTVSGGVNESVQTLTLNHDGDVISLLADSNNAFNHDITLNEGVNSMIVTAVDLAGNRGTVGIAVTLDTVVPAIPNLDVIDIIRPDENGNVIVIGRAGGAEPGGRVTVTNVRTGESVAVVADADGAFTVNIAAQVGDDIQITVTDAAGNTGDPAQASVTNLPPDPSLIAPPLNPTQITPLIDATAFLYTGGNPIQTGVQPGTIDAKRVAVIRGKVLDKQNNPLPGVTVTVKDHPEFGQTLSRADGMFDLVVNGGGTLTLDYRKENHLPVQRQVNTPWQDYIHADDIVMIQLDPQVTPIDLNSPAMQVARGTPQTDEDGTRQATLLFPAGTTATMTLPDGTTQALTTLHVRATEYTVGENGPQAMPGELPPASGYTYAVELSVDEVLQNGIKRNGVDVRLNQPVSFYVDNFLDFPVGGGVPVGYYDGDHAAWIPYDNGRIIKILSVQNDLAVLDVNGSGVPADQAQLNALGITDAERRQLAVLYQPGKSLWRVALTHLSTWDCNWPYGPPSDAIPPLPQQPQTADKDKPDVECQQPGCTIGAQSQSLGEEIPITGTPYSLHYRSDRAPGRRGKNIVTIPLSRGPLPDSLRRIEVDIEIVGQRLTKTFDPETPLDYTFEWDGRDGFGREVYGYGRAIISVAYVYPCRYFADNSDDRRTFAGAAGTFLIIGDRKNCPNFVFPRRWYVELESPLLGPVNVVGNWSLDVHHAWEAGRSRLLQGDGKHRQVRDGVFDTVAGNGQDEFAGDGGAAVLAALDGPDGLAVDPEGNLYIADSFNHRIRRVTPDGTITSLNAGFSFSSQGDGGPALEAGMNRPQGVAVDKHGNLYIAEREGHRVRRIDRNGIITTVAGTGTTGYSGDGGPATQAKLNAPEGVAVDAAGNLYIADTLNNRIRKVSPDGFITKVAGKEPSGFLGNQGFSGDGGPATNANLYHPSALAVDTQGNLYFADTINNRIRRVSRDGKIVTVAGSGSTGGFSGDGGQATQALLNRPQGVAVDTSGNIYIADTLNHRIRRVDPRGIITTVAGDGSRGFSGDSGPAAQVQLNFPEGLALDASGDLYIADNLNNRVRKLETQGLFSGQPTIASEDGSRQFVFDRGGRHLRTVNTFTGATEYSFGHDPFGNLITITDADGDVTTIERAGSAATAIIAPDGQRTELTVNSKHLTAVTNPAGETYRMQYTPDGLMTEFRDRKNLVNAFDYDAFGRLTQDINAGLGGWALTRTELNRGYQTTLTTAEGRQLNYTVEPQSNGDRLQVNTLANGSVQRTRFKPDGREISTQPDGTRITVRKGPDPRFGMQSPLPESLSVQTPNGLTSTTTTTRAAVLSDPDNLLSLQRLTEITRVNGRAFRSVYTADTKTFTFTSPEGRTSNQVINERGRPVSTQITGLAPVDFGYDVRGRLEQIVSDDGVEQRLTQLSYYAEGAQAGFLQSITDAENRTVRFEYDNVGRVTKQILPDSREIRYGYDANGNVTSITPPGRPAHIFNYNAFDLEDQYTPPDVSDIVNPATVYDYNLDKELIRITRPDGQEVSFNYNDKAQLTSMVIPRGAYSYGYNATTGQLDSITAPDGGTLSYDYDGFLPTGQTWAGDISGSVTQSYDNNFSISQRCVNASNCIDFSYDTDNLLTSAGSLSITRDPQRAGLVTDTALGNVSTAKGYNSFGELSTVDTDVNSADIYGVTYIRDKLGRIEQKTETVQGTTVTEIYGYDLVGRLETVTRNSTRTTYVYDSNGNRLSKTTGIDVESGTYDDQDRLTSYNGCDYEYTDNGELKTKTCGSEVTIYDYDVLGNLLGVTLPDGTEIGYVIDGQNRRVGRKVNGSLIQGFLYANQINPIAELNPDGSIKSRFVYGTKINVPDYMIKGGATYRIISDHLGSPRLVINAVDGTVVQRMDYDEFGQVIQDNNPGFQPFGFAGGLYDTDSGLVRFGARDYSAEIGRWTTKDTIGFLGLDTNLYGYTFNDPINFVDPSGRFGVAGAVYGAIAGAVGGAISGGVAGAIAGAVAGAVVGAVNPLASNAIGAAVGAGVASLVGQGIGNVVAGKDATSASNYSFPAAAGAAVGGGVGGPLGSAVGRFCGVIRFPIIGRSVAAAGISTAPQHTVGSIVEGASVGVGEAVGNRL